jgi:hypothetical protein
MLEPCATGCLDQSRSPTPKEIQRPSSGRACRVFRLAIPSPNQLAVGGSVEEFRGLVRMSSADTLSTSVGCLTRSTLAALPITRWQTLRHQRQTVRLPGLSSRDFVDRASQGPDGPVGLLPATQVERVSGIDNLSAADELTQAIPDRHS